MDSITRIYEEINDNQMSRYAQHRIPDKQRDIMHFALSNTSQQTLAKTQMDKLEAYLDHLEENRDYSQGLNHDFTTAQKSKFRMKH